MTIADKTRNAGQVCRNWGYDWAGLKQTAEPTPSQIIRAVAQSGWYGHSHTPRSAVRYFTQLDTCLSANHGGIRTNRPAQVIAYGDGAMSMVSAAGYAHMANLDRARKLYDRFARFVDYVLERRHNWTHVRDLYFADNSIEVEERSQLTGETRRRMKLGPGGDLCF